MRYVRGGGLTDERRAFRDQLRIEAAQRFAQGDENPVIAHDLRVSVRSVQRWAQSLVAGRAPGPGLQGPGIAAAAQ
ncbi:helix-turn-helix domain-containing protein [Streptomyces sp. NBC_00334]|uniref:helix-turn-helix domain-containing protein n=1 Tax=Streptomyces sp. NBC_00334 TaxID=2975713 RepID=UPI003FA7B10D